MSIWEYREVRSRIANKGDKYINEQQVLDGLTEMREMVAESLNGRKKHAVRLNDKKCTKQVSQLLKQKWKLRLLYQS
ncbi:Uncharacterised protein [Mannheimia haemolytica]|uniref:Uncharacterized protein n=1 Tax=Mannheimia haemolytica TaxID=75985 RepID=A0A378MWE2_MANHA|nr:Uncharacterised protein [Mannheimia haemolytica]